MSWQPCPEPTAAEGAESPRGIDMEIVPRTRDIGAFEVGRVLPFARRRMVGPFIFFDHMGPALLGPGAGMDVRPHPHIGLSTVTYLFEGSILHRDSLGSVQLITPGDMNWMTAGRGIVHSERSAPEARRREERLHGLQLWVALPEAAEETDPAFIHYPRASLPSLSGEGVEARVIAGSQFGQTSPVVTHSPLFYADIALQPGARLVLEPEYEERAIFLVEGRLRAEGRDYAPGRMLVLRPGCPVMLSALDACRLVALGGEPLEGPRHIWWNFVSSRPERIEAAKADWRETRFNAPIPEDDEFIPLPESI
jgi:redox-sensitive bicupin YhaK (pirin superfamily)